MEAGFLSLEVPWKGLSLSLTQARQWLKQPQIVSRATRAHCVLDLV